MLVASGALNDMPMLSVCLGLLIAAATDRLPLMSYIDRKDPSIKWSEAAPEGDVRRFKLTSQTWQGGDWNHDIALTQPPKPVGKNTAVLVITGGSPNTRDLVTAALISGQTGLPAAILFQIPNQPLYDKTEDDLIAHTFERFLATGDTSWPLLFPMTKAAIKAMDAIVDLTKKDANPIRKFIIAGASKRGWTTWLAAATQDPRIIGIAPMVIDTLNMPVQLKHQVELWGEFSSEIADYTKRNLQNQLNQPRGKELLAMVDPYAYRSRYRVPTLIVNGANDEYWSTDALNFYWNDLPQPKWACIIPNVGHSLGNGMTAIQSVASFARSLCGEFEMPKFSWQHEGTDAEPAIKIDYIGPLPVTLRIYSAESDTMDFRKSKWEVVAEMSRQAGDSQAWKPKIVIPPGKKNQALLAQVECGVMPNRLYLSSQVRLIKRK
ncbi:MAG: hypothetical protein HONBIEJF_02029 [Fimbriimonadaceae bacterium]|nr:hypothetical protein [Fimbriimonadaceae bacterium]